MSASQTNVKRSERMPLLATATRPAACSSLAQRRAGILPAFRASHPIFISPQGDFIFPHPVFPAPPNPPSQKISRVESVISLRRQENTLRNDLSRVRNAQITLRNRKNTLRLVKISQRNDKITLRSAVTTLRPHFSAQRGVLSALSAFNFQLSTFPLGHA
jgi:hypothetical protein